MSSALNEIVVPSKKSQISLADATFGLTFHQDTVVQPDIVSLCSYGNGVFSIQINNARLSKEVGIQMLLALNAAKQFDELKVLLIRGGEPDFLHGNRQQNNGALEQGLHTAITTFPYPVIAVVQGNAIGTGFMLASLCDFMICNEQAIYSFTNGLAGLFPSAGEDRLLHERFGPVHAYDFMYLSTEATGKELKEKGWSFPILPQEQIEPFAQKLALTLAKKPQKSLRLLKQHLVSRIHGFVSELPVVEPFSLTDQNQFVATGNNDSFASFINIRVETLEQNVLFINIKPVVKNYSVNDCLTHLTDIFDRAKKSARYKSIIIKSVNFELLPAFKKQVSPKTVSGFYNLILKSEIPVIAVLESNSTGFAWLLGLFCDCCVYNGTSSYSAIDPMQDQQLAKVAAMMFEHRFGYSACMEILLSGKEYTGLELQQQIKTLQVAGDGQAMQAAQKIATFWAKLPSSVLIDWKQYTAKTIQDKINGLPEPNETSGTQITDNQENDIMQVSLGPEKDKGLSKEPEEDFKPINDSAVPVLLNTNVISASAYEEGVLVIKMQDREAKNMFSHDLTQGIIEVFEHIKQTPA
ncbi:MAG: hypothetical protein HC896_03545, partial [Bacteroidales bacterium]|nr:hypothetical protein [Bacteroidales bacterium]